MGEVCWITADATPKVIGEVVRRSRKYSGSGDDVDMPGFVENDGLQSGISDKERMGLVVVVGGVDGLSARPETVLFLVWVI